MTTVIHLAISRDNMLSSNVESHWADRTKRAEAIRKMAFDMAQYHLRQPFRNAVIEVEVTWPDNWNRDAPNLWPTVKPALDGFVDAGLLEGDSDRYVDRIAYTTPAVRRNAPGVGAYLKFTFKEARS